MNIYAYYRQKYPNITPERAQRLAVSDLKKIKNANLWLGLALRGEYQRIPSSLRPFITAVALDIGTAQRYVDPLGIAEIPPQVPQPPPRPPAPTLSLSGEPSQPQIQEPSFWGSLWQQHYRPFIQGGFALYDTLFNFPLLFRRPSEYVSLLGKVFRDEHPVQHMPFLQSAFRIFRPFESAVAGVAGLGYLGYKYTPQGKLLQQVFPEADVQKFTETLVEEIADPYSPLVLSERVVQGLDKANYEVFKQRFGFYPHLPKGSPTLLDWTEVSYTKDGRTITEKIPVNEVDEYILRQQMGQISNLKVSDKVYRSFFTADLGFMTLNLPLLGGFVGELPIGGAKGVGLGIAKGASGFGVVGGFRLVKSPLKYLDDWVKTFKSTNALGKAGLVFDLGQQLVWANAFAPFVVLGKPFGLFRATGGRLSSPLLQTVGEVWGKTTSRILASHYLANSQFTDADRFLRVWRQLKDYAYRTKQPIVDLANSFQQKAQKLITDLGVAKIEYDQQRIQYDELLKNDPKLAKNPPPPPSPPTKVFEDNAELFDIFPNLRDDAQRYLETGDVGDALADIFNPVASDLLSKFASGGGLGRFTAENILRIQRGIDRVAQHRIGRYLFPITKLFIPRQRLAEGWVRQWAGQRMGLLEEQQRRTASVAKILTGADDAMETDIGRAVREVAEAISEDLSPALTEAYNAFWDIAQRSGVAEQITPEDIKAVLDEADRVRIADQDPNMTRDMKKAMADDIRKSSPLGQFIINLALHPKTQPLIDHRHIFSALDTLGRYNITPEGALYLNKIYDDISALRQKSPQLIQEWQGLVLDMLNNQPVDPRRYKDWVSRLENDPILQPYRKELEGIFSLIDSGGGFKVNLNPTEALHRKAKLLQEEAKRYRQRVDRLKATVPSANPCI